MFKSWYDPNACGEFDVTYILNLLFEKKIGVGELCILCII